jgi:hypothetical protein
VVVHNTRKFGFPEFCGSYAPLNLNISQYILLKQLVIKQCSVVADILDFRLTQNKNFAKDYPMAIHSQFWFNQLSSFIEKNVFR